MDGRALHLILLAGGRSRRATGEGDVPTQFRVTGRGPLFAVSLGEFLSLNSQAVGRPADLVVTVPDDWRATAEEALADLELPWTLAPAGTSRTASTWNAAAACADRFGPAAADLVAVHDAARPFASASLLERLVAAADRSGAAVPGVPVPDTIVQDGTEGARYLERSSLVAVQTPQVFRWDVFHAAHAWAAESGVEFTDDGGLLAARGQAPDVVPGEPGIWKVTTAADWRRAEALLKSS